VLLPSIDRAGLEALRVEQVKQADRASRRIVQGLADAAEALTPSQRVRLAAHLKAVHHKGAGLRAPFWLAYAYWPSQATPAQRSAAPLTLPSSHPPIQRVSVALPR